ncbi:hypothetical protein O6H91_18G065800 [Diphasiastrum complanatum]|uniref:Uncharacterized protein n=1 Tax=Diphasiastrum complanatum TaxID=34168 RepID=A0ACC2B2C2_DIPCM|nr:hypothetical protein O6H91_18G065800 [Diphasiastrum complanatum]
MGNLCICWMWAWLLLTTCSWIDRSEARDEADVLLEMKTVLDPEGNVLRSWTTGTDPCGGNFTGVTCNSQGNVASLSLQGHGLKGMIPAVVAELGDLTGLYLHYNSLQGQIPGAALSRLKHLTELYLNVNRLSGTIPSELGSLPSLQVLQLCCNALNGRIPDELGELGHLSILALQHNQLTDDIPLPFGSLSSITHLDLSFNMLTGPIPLSLGNLNTLKVLDVRNNNLSGSTPPGLQGLQQEFFYSNNLWLCGDGFANLPSCNSTGDLQNPEVLTGALSPSEDVPPFLQGLPAAPQGKAQPRSLATVVKVSVIAGVIAIAVGGAVATLVIFIWSRRQKQRVSFAHEDCIPKIQEQLKYFKDDIAYSDHSARKGKASAREAAATLHAVAASCSSGRSEYKLDELEMATNFFSTKCLVERNSHGSLYKASLRDGSTVTIKHLIKTTYGVGESELQAGLQNLTKFRHENIINLRGFCLSRGGAHCYLVYDFVSNGTLYEHLHVGVGPSLDWLTRVHVAYGIAKGLKYLHNAVPHAVCQHTVWASNILLDENYNALISEWGLTTILADEMVFADIKMSASLGYLAPEYALNGHLSEKTDVFAYGVLLLELLTGRKPVLVDTQRQSLAHMSNWVKNLFGSGNIHEVVDPTLRGKYSTAGVIGIINLAFACMDEAASKRPVMAHVVQRLSEIESLVDICLDWCSSSGEDYQCQQQAAYVEMLESGR